MPSQLPPIRAARLKWFNSSPEGPSPNSTADKSEEKVHTDKAYCRAPVFFSWLGKGTSRLLLLSMEEASRATGVRAPAEAGFDVEMGRVAIAGIKVLTGATTLVSFGKVQGGANKKEGQFYSAVRENALSRASL